MKRPTTIALDGPVASGKSTLGGLLAAELGYLYFDTGVMYRAATWAALDRDIDIADEQAVTAMTEKLLIKVIPPTEDDGRQYTVLADGQDITWAIRGPAIVRNVSPVSAYAGVRAALTAQQRRIAAQGPVVMVGRDIGTVVLPNANLKIYLDATPETRARRRYEEEVARGKDSDYDQVLADVLRRDQIDSSRPIAPLKPAQDAVIVDTTDLNIDQVLARLLQLVDQASGKENG